MHIIQAHTFALRCVPVEDTASYRRLWRDPLLSASGLSDRRQETGFLISRLLVLLAVLVDEGEGFLVGGRHLIEVVWNPRSRLRLAHGAGLLAAHQLFKFLGILVRLQLLAGANRRLDLLDAVEELAVVLVDAGDLLLPCYVVQRYLTRVDQLSVSL